MKPLYRAAGVRRASLRVPLPWIPPPAQTAASLRATLGRVPVVDVARYYVVFANRPSASAPATFDASVRHEWIPTSRLQLRTGMELAMVALLVLWILLLATWKERPRAQDGDYAVPPSSPRG